VGRRGASAAAAPDARTDRYVAHDALEKIGFGVKALPYPEHVALAWAATTVDQPVKWIAGRTESHLGDHHGRDFRRRVRSPSTRTATSGRPRNWRLTRRPER
jgi:carbon-monoxide dehydrogenase large subunit